MCRDTIAQRSESVAAPAASVLTCRLYLNFVSTSCRFRQSHKSAGRLADDPRACRRRHRATIGCDAFTPLEPPRRLFREGLSPPHASRVDAVLASKAPFLSSTSEPARCNGCRIDLAVLSGIANPGANCRLSRWRTRLRPGHGRLSGSVWLVVEVIFPPIATSLAARFSIRRLTVSFTPSLVLATMGGWCFAPRIRPAGSIVGEAAAAGSDAPAAPRGL